MWRGKTASVIVMQYCRKGAKGSSWSCTTSLISVNHGFYGGIRQLANDFPLDWKRSWTYILHYNVCNILPCV
jgi:hypothetical protein